MKHKLAFGLAAVFALVAVLATAATSRPIPPPPSGVQNPMTANLDAGGYNIGDVGQITAQADLQTNGYVVADKLVAMGAQVILEPPNTPVVTITASAAPPTDPANFGSLDLSNNPAGLWLMTETGWRQIALAP